MSNLKNLKYLNNVNSKKYIEIFDCIISKIENLKIKLLNIDKLKIQDNSIYSESFGLLKEDNYKTINKVEIHLEQIYNIKKEEAAILEALKIINEIFPDVDLLTTNVITFNQYREYIFPLKFVEVLIGNFSSELHYRNKNDIVFSNKSIKRHRMYRSDYPARTGVNIINYYSFINKILSIVQFGYSLSNNKLVNIASTVRIYRNF